jgi:hypothetical protein
MDPVRIQKQMHALSREMHTQQKALLLAAFVLGNTDHAESTNLDESTQTNEEFLFGLALHACLGQPEFDTSCSMEK